MLDGQVKRPLGQGHVVHAVAQAPVGQAVLAHVEAVTLPAQEVFFRHDQVLDLDLRVAAAHDVGKRALSGHGRNVALDDVARVGQLDDEGRIALVTRRVGVGHGHHHRQVRGAGGGREPLLAVQDVVALAVLDRPGLHARGVGAGGLLRHGVADALLAVQQRLEVLFLLEVGAVRQQGQHGGVVRTLAVHRQGAQVAFAQFHLDKGIGQGAKTHAAVFLGDEGAPEALGPRLGPQLGQYDLEGLPVHQTLLGRNALLVHPAAHPLADRLCVFRNLEIDRHGSLPCLVEATLRSEGFRGKALTRRQVRSTR